MFVMVKCAVLFEVRTGLLNNIETNFVLKGKDIAINKCALPILKWKDSLYKHEIDMK
jgi:hypothetical protein